MKIKTFSFGLAVLVLIFVLILSTVRTGAGAFHAPGNSTQTAIPPAIQTQIAPTVAISTQVNPTLIISTSQPSAPPKFDLQKMYPVLPEAPSAEQVLGQKIEGQTAGDGLLRQINPPALLEGAEAGAYELSNLAWEGWTYDSYITIWPGYASKSASQGILWVQITPHYKSYQDKFAVQSPVQAGKLSIVGAVGERLIVNSDQGQTFYFDVPSLRFVETLTANVSPATSVPQQTNPSTADAPDLPVDAIDYQPINVPLDSFISASGDYDWFHFYSGVPGAITVSLVPRSGNYGLRVVLVDQNQSAAILQEDTTSGRNRKQIVISDAPSGDYLVRVWSLDGSFSDSQPYTLRFDAPEPQKIIPILECVTENPSGTYTAHFGYNNPNSFVVVVDAKDHQNKFEPPPSFRTGQPEAFAPGQVTDWFSVLFDGNGLTWLLDGQPVTANRNAPRCP